MAVKELVRDEATAQARPTIDVDVIPSAGANGGIDWDLNIRTHGYGKGKNVDAKHGTGYEIRFDLVNPDQLDVRFDASAPIFVRVGGGTFCPTKFGTDQMMVDSCTAKDLVVIDWNYGQPCILNYQLNFVDSKGNPVEPFDPIIENGGGGVHP